MSIATTSQQNHVSCKSAFVQAMHSLKSAILEATNKGLDVFKHFMGQNFVQANKAFKNPFYEDTKASCQVYFDKQNNLYKYKDFGNPDYAGDCFSLVGKIHQLDCSNTHEFIRILHVINEQLRLQLVTNERSTNPERRQPSFNRSYAPTPAQQQAKAPESKPETENAARLVSLQLRNFGKEELGYWQPYGISLNILHRYQVKAIQQLNCTNKEGKEYTIRYSSSEPLFGYQGRKHMKVYRPLSKYRFMYTGQMPENYIFGLEQLPMRGDILFITGGEKDVMSLAARSFNAVCLNSETAHLPKNLLRGLGYRFKHIVLLYDVDETGIAAMDRICKENPEIKRLRLPLAGTKEEKDISDYFKLGNTADQLRGLFLEMLDKLYEDTVSVLKSCEINFDKPPVAPESIISINGVNIGTEGNLLCITGAEGSGKTNYLGGILSGAIKPANREIDTLGTSIKNNEDQKVVLLYDTEQSEFQLYKNLSNILRRASLTRPPTHFKAVCLMGISRSERLNIIFESMDNYYYQFGGIHLVVIDGIADLIASVNDEASSVQLIEELFRMSAIYKTCIVCVLHMTPSGMKLRGHLGSEVQRKAAGILLVEKDDKSNCSVVKALKVRDGSPLDVPIIQFGWSSRENRHVFLGEKSKEESEQRKTEDLKAYAQDLFKQSTTLSQGEISLSLMNDFQIKERMARNYLKLMKEQNIIIKNTTNPALYCLNNQQSPNIAYD